MFKDLFEQCTGRDWDYMTEYLEEAKRVKGKEYTSYYSSHGMRLDQSEFKNGGEYLNADTAGSVSTGSGILDSVAQNFIEEINVEKEKCILESENIVSEYLMYCKNLAFKNNKKSTKDSNDMLWDRMNEELYVLNRELGIDMDTTTNIVFGDYFGVDKIYEYIDDRMDRGEHPYTAKMSANKNAQCKSIIIRILKLRLNYINKIINLMSDMIKHNYKMLGLTEQEAEAYISSLTSGDNKAVKAAGDIKELIKRNKDKFIKNDGKMLDLTSLGFGIAISGERDLGIDGKGSNENILLDQIQKLMRYDVVVFAHGGENDRNDEMYHHSDFIKYMSIQQLIKKEYTNLKNSKFCKKEAVTKSVSDSRMLVDNSEECDNAIKEEVKNLYYKLNRIYEAKGKANDNQLLNIFNATLNKLHKSFIDSFISSDLFKNEISSNKEDGPYVKSYTTGFSIGVKYGIGLKLRDYTADKLQDIPSSKYWSCQPTRSLKAGPFTNVNELVRQLIKEGFKKILIQDCNPGHHELAPDIMKTKGVIINYSNHSNYAESSIGQDIASDNEPYAYIIEMENGIKSMAESYGIDYYDDAYLNECMSWYYEDIDLLNEGIGETLLAFFKRIVAAIIGFFKGIFNFFKMLIQKVKELFTGSDSSGVAKDTKTEFKEVKANLINAREKKIVEIKGKTRDELKQKADRVNNEIAKEIRIFKASQDKDIKAIERDIKTLEREVAQNGYMEMCVDILGLM